MAVCEADALTSVLAAPTLVLAAVSLPGSVLSVGSGVGDARQKSSTHAKLGPNQPQSVALAQPTSQTPVLLSLAPVFVQTADGARSSQLASLVQLRVQTSEMHWSPPHPSVQGFRCDSPPAVGLLVTRPPQALTQDSSASPSQVNLILGAFAISFFPTVSFDQALTHVGHDLLIVSR